MTEWNVGDWCFYRISNDRDPADRRIRIIHAVRVEIVHLLTKQRATIRLLDYPRMRARTVSLYRLQP